MVAARGRARNFKRPFSSKGKVRLNLRGVKHARPRSRIGDFSGPSSARGAKFRGVLASRASEGQGGLSAQGLNRMGSGIGGGSGQLESIEGPRRCSGRCPGGPAQMREDLGDHGGIFDGGDDRQGATTLGAVFQVDIEHPFTKALPGFRSSGRRSPFKTAPGGFVSSRAQLMRVGAEGGGASA